MSTSRRRIGFTLVELLVVVAILSVLIALLLPSLNKARYVAKKAVCASNQSQLARGLIIYATEYNSYFPSSGDTRWNGRPWDQAMTTLAANYLSQWDVRPLIRPYWGSRDGERTQLEQCPLAPVIPHSNNIWKAGTTDRLTSYLFFFNFSYRPFQSTNQSQPMVRSYDLFKPNTSDDWGVRTLICDVLAETQHTQKRYTNHHEFAPAYTENSSWYFQYAYTTPNGVRAATTANFANDDGSVAEHRLRANDLSGFQRLHPAFNQAAQIVPIDHVMAD